MPQTIQLTPEEANQKGQNFIRLIRSDLRDRKSMIDKRAYIRAIYFGDQNRVFRAIEDTPGQSNIHLHVMTSRIEGIVPKISNAFWNADPIVNVRRVAEEFDPELTRLNEVFLNWALETDIPDFYSTTEQWFRNMLLDGVSVVKAWWKFSTRNTVIIEPVKHTYRQGDYDASSQQVPADRLKTPEEILVELFGLMPLQKELTSVIAETLEEGLIGSTFRIAFVEDRIEYRDVRVEFHASRYIDEISVYIYRPIIVENRPIIETVEFEDLIVPYRTSCLQNAERISHQYWLTIAEIKHKMKSEEEGGEGWDITEEDLDSLRGVALSGSENRREEHIENKTLQRQKDRQVGEFNTGDSPTGDDPYFDKKILIYEVYAKDDLTGDGVGEEVIYQIPHKLEKVVRANYLEELFPHGRRPFADIHNIRISDRYYSLSYGELLAPINVEVNTIINQVNEAQELINHPWFFYVPAAMTVDPDILKGIEYGEGVPVADINGVLFPQFPQTPLANLSTMDSLLMFADQLTISPQAMGSSQVRNAPRTARGTLALLSEGGIKTDMVIRSAQKGGWNELVHQVHSLYEAFGPDEKYFYVTGEEKPLRIRNKELQGRFEYAFSGNTTNTNKEVVRSIVQVAVTTMLAEPMYLQDLQARQNLIRHWWNHWGEGVNTDEVIPKIPGQGGSRPAMDQLTENKIIESGMPLDVLPLDNDADHIAKIDKRTQEKTFEMLDPQIVALYADHRNQHEQQMLAKQQAGQLAQGTGGGMGNNVPTGLSLNQGGTDSNALEGGIP
jgi:hypothetical protein